MGSQVSPRYQHNFNEIAIHTCIQLVSVSWYRHVLYEHEKSTQPRYRYRYSMLVSAHPYLKQNKNPPKKHGCVRNCVRTDSFWLPSRQVNSQEACSGSLFCSGPAHGAQKNTVGVKGWWEVNLGGIISG